MQIKVQDRALAIDTKDKLLYAKVERLFESYKHFTKRIETKKFLGEMKHYAILFRSTFDPGSVNQPIEADNSISRINNVIFGLDSSVLIPYVLFVAGKTKDDSQALSRILKAVETYMVRRIIVRANTKQYNNFFTESLILNDIHTAEGFRDFLQTRGDKLLYMPNDEQLLDGFNNSHLTNGYARGILYLLESEMRDYRRHSNNLLALKKYSLEHLMPKKWENKWGEVADQEAKDYRNHKLLTLGNLALITQTLNTTINDSDWQTKLDGRGNHKGLRAYASGLETSDYLSCKTWDETAIQDRALALYDHAVLTWKH